MNVQADSDFFHSSIAEWLAKGDYGLLKEFVLAGPSRTTRHGREVFEVFTPPDRDGVWAWMSVSVSRGDPIAEVYMTDGTCDLARSAPILNGHLQGTDGGALHATIDFQTGRWSGRPMSVGATAYVPQDGNQTGGNWAYMQFRTPIEWLTLNEWRDQLYPHARYGGRFVRHDGLAVTEKDYPKAVLQNGTHWHRDTPTWIHYSDPRNPWRDRSVMRTADDQHFSVYDALFEVYAKFPHDECLRREVIFAANRALFQLPGEDKGTYQWRPGQSRARGRVLKALAKAVFACIEAGDAELAVRVLARLVKRLDNQVIEFVKKLQRGESPWPTFGGPGKHAPHEIGIWFWGLEAAQRLFAIQRTEYRALELRTMKKYLSQFCFDAFYLDGNGELQLPYIVKSDWTHERTPASGRHFAWMAAVGAEVTTKADEDKMLKLIEFGETLEERYKL